MARSVAAASDAQALVPFFAFSDAKDHQNFEITEEEINEKNIREELQNFLNNLPKSNAIDEKSKNKPIEQRLKEKFTDLDNISLTELRHKVVLMLRTLNPAFLNESSYRVTLHRIANKLSELIKKMAGEAEARKPAVKLDGR